MERDSLGRFAIGRIMTPEEKLKVSISLREAAKLRDDYIGDIKNEYPRIYNSWRAIMFTEKGKRAGVDDKWKKFRDFFNDVISTYNSGLLLRRKDTREKWGPDNFVWVTKEQAGAMRALAFVEYNGETHSLKEWSDILNQSFGGVKIRYFNRDKYNYSTEEILFGRRRNRDSKCAKDKNDTKTSIRAKASKMISSYRCADKKMGVCECDIDIEWMIDNILLKPCHYCGDIKRVGCDRIDNTKGHTKDNVVPCCIECNSARNNYFSYDEMIVLGKTIAEIKSKRQQSTAQLKTDSEIDEEKTHDLAYLARIRQRKVYKYSLLKELICVYESEKEAADVNNVSVKSLNAAVNGKGYRKSYDGHKLKGFLWFKNEL